MNKLSVIFTLVILFAFTVGASIASAAEFKTFYIKSNAQVGVLRGVTSISTANYEMEKHFNDVVVEIKKVRSVNSKSSGGVYTNILQFLKKRDLDIPYTSIAFISDDK